MDIKNMALIFVVIVATVAIITRLIKKNKSEEIDNKIDVDDKTYTLEIMIKFVKKRLGHGSVIIYPSSLNSAIKFASVGLGLLFR